MKRRIFAWALLAGFIFVFVDLVFIGFMRPFFSIVYIIAVLAFLMINSGNKNKDN